MFEIERRSFLEYESYTLGQISAAYKEYLKTELATISNRSIIYENGWYYRLGLAICYPHPHRHFTYEEFVKCGINDDNLFKTFIK